MRWVGALVAVGLVVAGLSPAEGSDRTGPGRHPREGFGYAPGWHVRIGGACRDTIATPWHDVMPVAVSVLVDDDWRVQSTDRVGGRIVTEWQPVRHALVSLFFGKVRERCVVDFFAFNGDSCIVLFRAGLVTQKDIAGHPLLSHVRKAYLDGVQDWQQKVRRSPKVAADGG